MPLTLGDTFPNFDAEALGVEKFNLYEYLGDSWGIMFSHPNDFTPVCTTELAEAVKLYKKFMEKNCKLVGFSCNDMNSHKEWAKDIMSYGGACGDLPYPLVCDPERNLAASLGIMDPAEKDKAGLPLTCRSVFFISPQKKLAASILYPATTGRSFKEILRVLDSLQLTEQHPVATPVEWTSGGTCCVVPSLSEEEAKSKLPKGHQVQSLPSGKAYLRLTPDPRS
ncbi:peroxidoxin 2, putative [Eimeria praecox]|uniref:Peroxidoxin 2, putative n=1 Tax=Eimeria praecox TaxID=51316 RepID=U6GP53_9EIME|nr:peroxidoxin 2, putative [Eimeria praecox]